MNTVIHEGLSKAPVELDVSVGMTGVRGGNDERLRKAFEEGEAV